MSAVLSVPAELLATLVSIASHHVENVESGLQDGSYKAADNADIPQLKVDLVQLAELLLGAKPPAVWMMSLPVLSSQHLSQETGAGTLAKAFPWLQVAEYETGFFVKVDKAEDRFLEYPEDLRAVLAWARNRGDEWIRLDSVGDDVDGLRIYDW